MEGIIDLNAQVAAQSPQLLEKPGQPVESAGRSEPEQKSNKKTLKHRRKKRSKKTVSVTGTSSGAPMVPRLSQNAGSASKDSQVKTSDLVQPTDPARTTNEQRSVQETPRNRQPHTTQRVPANKQTQRHSTQKQADLPSNADEAQSLGKKPRKSNVQSRVVQQPSSHQQSLAQRQHSGRVQGDSYGGLQDVNLASINIPAFYRDIDTRYQACRAQKTIFVLQKPELAIHNSITRDRLQRSLANSDTAVLTGLKQCEESMNCVLAGRSVNKDAHWSAQLQRLRDEYEDALEKQKLVSERLLAQRQRELERWQERVEELERSTSRFLAL